MLALPAKLVQAGGALFAGHAGAAGAGGGAAAGGRRSDEQVLTGPDGTPSALVRGATLPELRAAVLQACPAVDDYGEVAAQLMAPPEGPGGYAAVTQACARYAVSAVRVNAGAALARDAVSIDHGQTDVDYISVIGTGALGGGMAALPALQPYFEGVGARGAMKRAVDFNAQLAGTGGGGGASFAAPLTLCCRRARAR